MSKEVLKRLLDAEKLQYCYECGICTATCPVAQLLGEYYNPRVLLEKILVDAENVLASDELWLCAWCYRCYERCPQALKLPEIFLFMKEISIRHGLRQPLESALQKIVEKVPLPAVATMACFHPERAGISQEEVLEKIEQIRKKCSKVKKEKKTIKNAEAKVAVVGSGPAGLTVAYELARKGYNVTIFEALPEFGGMLSECVPEYRLPKKVLEKEVQSLKDLNVEMRANVRIGKDLGFDDLWEEGYKAVFLGTGAHKCQDLQIEGRSLKGVSRAIDFLRDVKRGKKKEIGRKVVMIGGGNVALDAAKAALRLQAEEVTVLYRRSRDEMPASPWEVKEAEDDGVKIELLVSPTKIFGENGKVSRLECVRTQLGELDDTGRRKPTPIEGSEFTIGADMIILGIGQTPDLKFLPKEIELNEDGTIWVNPVTMETSLQGVFAGGDAVTGPATVIEAIEAGKRAATSIDNYLRS